MSEDFSRVMKMTKGFQPLTPRFDSMPAELVVIDKWVLWRAIERDGRITKVPFAATGRPAKTNDPSTWCSFEAAKAAYNAGGYDGVGFVLDGTDGIVGVDLDKVDDHRHQPEVRAVVQALKASGCYIEASPSGKGLRAFLFGKLPFPGANCRTLGVEIYQSGRYLTITGHDLRNAHL